MSKNSIGLIDRSLSGGSDGNKGVLCIPALVEPILDCLVSYLGHSLIGGWSCPSAEMQPVYFTALTNWVGVK